MTGSTIDPQSPRSDAPRIELKPAPAVRFLKLDERASVPAYQSELAAGLDLAACLPRHEFDGESCELIPGAILKIPIGLACAIPAGYEGQVRPRSGISTKFGVTVPNAPGTVDADYRGELMVALMNLSSVPFTVHHGDRIAQLVIAPIAHCRVVEVDTLDETERGAGGFGSTGGVRGR